MDTDREVEAARIYAALKQAAELDLMELAWLLADRSAGEVVGAAEFAVRDRVHRIGAKAIATALEGRKRGGTTGRVGPARTAGTRRGSTAGSPKSC